MSEGEGDVLKFYLAHPDRAVRAMQGRRMGVKTSPAKARAVRINGRSGGRPINLGILFHKRYDKEHRNPVKVAYSRSWGGILFTYPDGHREFYTEGTCSSPEEAVILLDAWWGAPEAVVTPDGRNEPDFDWYPFWPQGVPIGRRKPRKKVVG